jgi:hypothetical protein
VSFATITISVASQQVFAVVVVVVVVVYFVTDSVHKLLDTPSNFPQISPQKFCMNFFLSHVNYMPSPLKSNCTDHNYSCQKNELLQHPK